MNFNDYQTRSRKTAGYPPIGHPVIYPTLGLVNEAGEVAGKIKRIHRDDNDVLTEDRRRQILIECGDVYWYLNRLVAKLDSTMYVVRGMNIDKLRDRAARNVLKGEGDNR